MSYYMTKTVSMPFEEALERTVAGLKAEGFGVVSEVDVSGILKKKLDVPFRKYRILGACNPGLAHRALQSENKIGVMLPCNLVVQETDGGGTEVSTIDPAESMQAVGNPGLADLAGTVRAALRRVLDGIESRGGAAAD
ncbi:MAG: DUF302 domain-containing protein [Candidatus Latescibacterota bacterium]|jgi:uncharacterized protein (DUF302 family)|nr:MAG: DUF302 domain-containing protein [Candidatus Latescibacterota bacterium]